MAWNAPVKLRPSAADLAISRACLHVANPALERPLRVVTWLADEKIMLGAVGVFWAATRLSRSRPLRREADAMLCSVLIAGAVPDLFKYLVRRKAAKSHPGAPPRHPCPPAWQCLGFVSVRPRHAFERDRGFGAAADAAALARDAVEQVRRACRHSRHAAGALSKRRPCRLGHRRSDQQSSVPRLCQGRTNRVTKHNRGDAAAAVLGSLLMMAPAMTIEER